MKHQCRRIGCPVLLNAPGWCIAHARIATPSPFRKLDERKTDVQRKFYGSQAWRVASERHRIREPLCRQCRARGRVVVGTLAHHNPSYEKLVARGLNPLDDQYLETLCESCHLAELRAKRQ